MIGSRLCATLVLGLVSIISVGIADAETLVLRGGNVYTSPDAVPLANAVVVATDGVVSAVGSASDVQIPGGARVIDCTGKTIVAGFWNSHVHFTQAVWQHAGTAPAAPMTAHMQEMLTKWGFTTVWDLGSDPPRLAGAAPPCLCRRDPGSQHPAGGRYLPQGRSSRLSARRDAAPRGRYGKRSCQDGAGGPRHGPRRHEAFHRRLSG